MQKRKQRCHWLDIAKGIAIVLVVFGHVLSSYDNAGLVGKEGYLKFIANFFSSFRMPFFFFASGLTFALRGDREAPLSQQLLKRFCACFIPYVSCTVVLWLLKVGSMPVVNNPVTSFAPVRILLYPMGYVWFLYALMLTQFVGVLLERARAPRWVFVALSFAALVFSGKITALPGISGSVIEDVADMSFFFAAGYILQERFFRLMEKACAWHAAAGFAALLGLSAVRWLLSIWLGDNAQIAAQIWVFPAGVAMMVGQAAAGIFMLCALSKALGRKKRLEALGENTMPVYLMHCVAVAAMRVLLTAIGLPLGTGWLHFMICLAAGTLLPLLIYWPISKVKWLDFWFYPMRYIRLGGKKHGRLESGTGA